MPRKPEGELPPEEITEKPVDEPKQELPKIEDINKEVENRIEKLETALKAEQRAGLQKSQDYRRLEAQLEGMRSDRGLAEAAITLLARQQGRSEEEITEEVRTKQPDLLQQLQTIRGQEEAQRTVIQYKNRVESLGLTTEDDDYWDIKDFVESGKYDRAERKLKKLEASKVEVKPQEIKTESKVLTEEEEAEIARRYLEKQGTLKTDIGMPSASVGSFEKKARAYANGEISYAEYAEARKQANLE